MWQMILVLHLCRLSAGLDGKEHIYIIPPDDGLQMGPKHVEMW
jgi:hypothetical protein